MVINSGHLSQQDQPESKNLVVLLQVSIHTKVLQFGLKHIRGHQTWIAGTKTSGSL